MSYNLRQRDAEPELQDQALQSSTFAGQPASQQGIIQPREMFNDPLAAVHQQFNPFDQSNGFDNSIDLSGNIAPIQHQQADIANYNPEEDYNNAGDYVQQAPAQEGPFSNFFDNFAPYQPQGAIVNPIPQPLAAPDQFDDLDLVDFDALVQQEQQEAAIATPSEQQAVNAAGQLIDGQPQLEPSNYSPELQMVQQEFNASHAQTVFDLQFLDKNYNVRFWVDYANLEWLKRALQTTSMDSFVQIIQGRLSTGRKIKDINLKESMFCSRMDTVVRFHTSPGHVPKPADWLQDAAQWNAHCKHYEVSDGTPVTFLYDKGKESEEMLFFQRKAGKLYKVDESGLSDLATLFKKAKSANPGFDLWQPPETSFEELYIQLVNAHVDEVSGKHRPRDEMFKWIRLHSSSSTKRDLCYKFAEVCPKCSEKFRIKGAATRQQWVNSRNRAAAKRGLQEGDRDVKRRKIEAHPVTPIDENAAGLHNNPLEGSGHVNNIGTQAIDPDTVVLLNSLVQYSATPSGSQDAEDNTENLEPTANSTTEGSRSTNSGGYNIDRADLNVLMTLPFALSEMSKEDGRQCDDDL